MGEQRTGVSFPARPVLGQQGEGSLQKSLVVPLRGPQNRHTVCNPRTKTLSPECQKSPQGTQAARMPFV